MAESPIQIVPKEIEILYPTPSDLNELMKLPMHHRDPFDRMLIAQAINSSLLLMSNDGNFGKYAIDLVEK